MRGLCSWLKKILAEQSGRARLGRLGVGLEKPGGAGKRTEEAGQAGGVHCGR